MKKAISMLLVICMLLLGTAACGTQNDGNASKTLYAQGLDIVNMLSEMTRSDDFIGLYTANSSIQECILSLGEQVYGSPDAVYSITVPEDALLDMTEWKQLQNVSEDLRCYVLQRVHASLIGQVNAMGGAEKLAASSLCTVEKTFLCESADRNVIYLYVYDDAAPVAVTFTLGEDHTVSASGTFVLYEGFACGSAEEIRSAFSDIPVEVAGIYPES